VGEGWIFPCKFLFLFLFLVVIIIALTFIGSLLLFVRFMTYRRSRSLRKAGFGRGRGRGRGSDGQYRAPEAPWQEYMS
jgi:hypothetical protein